VDSWLRPGPVAVLGFLAFTLAARAPWLAAQRRANAASRYHRLVPITVPTTDAELAAKLFRGLGDPTRLEILLVLQAGERRVVDLVNELDSSQANVSGHLACLKDCGLIADRAHGRANYYSLARPELADLLHSAEALLGAVGHNVDLCCNYEQPATKRSRKRSA
jgi:ArsR family transcriptional regulator